jgi:hypothetical protein
LLVRWAPGARYAQQGNNRMLLENRLPVLMGRYTRGFATDDGDFPYQAYAFSIDHRFQAIRGGVCRIQLNGGFNDRALPRSRMRVFRSNFARGNFSDLRNAFNTMRYGEFQADRYAEAFFYFSPKLRWLSIGHAIKPKFQFSFAAAWGDFLSGSDSLHFGIDMRAPSNIYLEPGITLSHFLPRPKSDHLYATWLRSISVGVYYRAGAYTFSEVRENFAVRVGMGML